MSTSGTNATSLINVAGMAGIDRVEDVSASRGPAMKIVFVDGVEVTVTQAVFNKSLFDVWLPPERPSAIITASVMPNADRDRVMQKINELALKASTTSEGKTMQSKNAEVNAAPENQVRKSNKTLKPADIKVGTTYVNRGAGKTRRKVIAIGVEHRPSRFLSMNQAPDEDGVLYEQNGKQDRLYISSFASWCGKAVEGADKPA